MAVRSEGDVRLTATYHDPPAMVRKVVMKAVALIMYGQGETAVVAGERYKSCDTTICAVERRR